MYQDHGYPCPRFERNEFQFPIGSPVEIKTRSWHLVELGASGVVLPVELIEFEVNNVTSRIAFEIMVPDIVIQGPASPSAPIGSSQFLYMARFGIYSVPLVLVGDKCRCP